MTTIYYRGFVINVMYRNEWEAIGESLQAHIRDVFREQGETFDEVVENTKTAIDVWYEQQESRVYA